MAKEQNLALNPTKISGQCGRLLCCLGYEFDTYCELRKGLPKCGKHLTCGGVEGEVVKINTLARSFTLRTPDRKEIQCTPEDINREVAAPPLPEPARKEPSQQKKTEKAVVAPPPEPKGADNATEKSGSSRRRRSRNRNRSDSAKGKTEQPKETK
jgi:hypothetical protein